MIFFLESLHGFFVKRVHNFFWWTGCLIFLVERLHAFVVGEVA